MKKDERVVRLGAPVCARRQPLIRQRPPGDGLFPPLARLLAAKEVGESAEATVISARGLSGVPWSGHCPAAAMSFLDRVLGQVEVAVTAHHRAKDLRRQETQQVLDRTARRAGGHVSSRRTPR